jgi:hypothetical protein
MVSFVVFLLIAIFVYSDAKKREMSPVKPAVLTALFGALAAPFYFAQRNLKEGERREGGKWWNVVKWFALFWTISMGISFISSLVSVGVDMDPNMDEYEAAGTAIGVGIGVMLWGVLWFGGMATALIVGMLAKNNSIIEEGPTVIKEVKPAVN